MLRSIKLCFLWALVAGLTACATPMIESIPLKSGETAVGLAYSVPKAQTRLQISRRVVQAEEVERAKKAADDAAAIKKKTADEKKLLEAAVESLKGELKAARDAKAEAATLTDITVRLQVAEARLALATAAATKADAAATAAEKIYQTVFGRVGRLAEQVTFTALAPVADPAARYVARHRESPLRDDNLKLSVNAGLLSSGEATAAGQIPAVILAIARTAAAFQTGTDFSLKRSDRTQFGLLAQKEAPPTQDKCPAYELDLVFDPTNPEELMEAMAQVDKRSAGTLALRSSSRGNTPPPSPPTPRTEFGLVYPAMVSVGLVVESIDHPNCPARENPAPARLQMVVPDALTRMVLPLDGAMFTKSSIKHVFKDGLLTELSIDRPSTALAVASLPIEVLKAIVSIPAEIIKLRVDYSSQQTAEVNQQVKLLEAQIALLKAEADLKAKQGAETP